MGRTVRRWSAAPDGIMYGSEPTKTPKHRCKDGTTNGNMIPLPTQHTSPPGVRHRLTVQRGSPGATTPRICARDSRSKTSRPTRQILAATGPASHSGQGGPLVDVEPSASAGGDARRPVPGKMGREDRCPRPSRRREHRSAARASPICIQHESALTAQLMRPSVDMDLERPGVHAIALHWRSRAAAGRGCKSRHRLNP